MNEPQVIERDFQGFNIRTLVKNEDEIWCVAKDVMSVLGITNTADALKNLDEDELGWVATTDPMGRVRDTRIISESALYGIILKRRKGRVADPVVKERVEQFQRWVRKDLLPTLRKTGSYDMGQARPQEPVHKTVVSDTPALDALRLNVQAHEETHARITRVETGLRAELADLKQQLAMVMTQQDAIMVPQIESKPIEKPEQKALPVKTNSNPYLRSRCHALVKQLAVAPYTHHNIWSQAYDLLHFNHGIDVRRLNKQYRFKALIDVAEHENALPALEDSLLTIAEKHGVPVN